MSGKLKKTILLVEDETIIAIEEAMTLENNNYEVIIAATGEEAFQIITNDGKIDLVLMDINLGQGMDGTVAAKEILKVKELPLIFLSSHTEKEIVENTEDISSYGYIVKNSGETVLLTSIKMAFKLFKARNEFQNASVILDSTFNSINDAITVLDLENNILKCNDAFREFLNKTDDDLIGKKCMNVVHGINSPPTECPFLKMLKSEKRERMDMPIGNKFYEVVVDPLFDEHGRLSKAVHLIIDITEYKEIEKLLKVRIQNLTKPDSEIEELKFEELFNSQEIENLLDDFSAVTGVASLITRPDGTPITKHSNSSKFCKIVRSTEKGKAACIASDSEACSILKKGATVRRCTSCGLIDAGSAIVVEGQHLANWCVGQVRDTSMDVNKIREKASDFGIDPQKLVNAFLELEVMDDQQITRISKLLDTIAAIISKVAYQNLQQARTLFEVRANEEKIKKLLDEKEVLLKEVHHRIKNNMSSVESLLTLQLEEVESTEAKDALADASLRVNSVRILYEKLLDTDAYATLPVNVFIEDIINGIQQVFPDNNDVDLTLNIDEILIDSQKMFNFGLIVNELITNTYKHALKSSNNGEILISMKDYGEHLIFELTDNGVGLPEGFSLVDNKSFGLKLVKILAEQLNGSFEISNRNDGKTGVVCSLTMAPDL